MSENASKKRGGQPRNKNAVGNRGGGAPLGNKNAWRHGAYERYPPIYPGEREYLKLAEEREKLKREKLYQWCKEQGLIQ